ncbi:MAG: CsgG/HfaB family protein [Fidelibacterota bacterium]
MMEGMHVTTEGMVEEIGTGEALDQMIEEVVSDLFTQDIEINSVAVWRIRSDAPGLDGESIRQKLITRLVNLNRFKVVSRERLSELLQEQGLSLSGTILDTTAVEIGNLIGVEGFVDAYVSVEDSRLVLSCSLIETKTGVIIWAKTIERPAQL